MRVVGTFTARWLYVASPNAIAAPGATSRPPQSVRRRLGVRSTVTTSPTPSATSDAVLCAKASAAPSIGTVAAAAVRRPLERAEAASPTASRTEGREDPHGIRMPSGCQVVLLELLVMAWAQEVAAERVGEKTRDRDVGRRNEEAASCSSRQQQQREHDRCI
jgi:hypothetical protein